MQTRKSTEGPGQGDSAAAQELRENIKKNVEEPTDMKPFLTAGLPGRAEMELELLKETTSTLAQEVLILRGFAQDTLEIIKELREERLRSRQSQPVQSYYGAQGTAGPTKTTLPGAGASAALYGALGALPEQRAPPAALPTAFDRVVSNSSVGYIVEVLVTRPRQIHLYRLFSFVRRDLMLLEEVSTHKVELLCQWTLHLDRTMTARRSSTSSRQVPSLELNHTTVVNRCTEK